MDPSALIFVALAVAWAAYLIPMAVRHHDESTRSRSVDRFSHTMRVLARREPVSAKDARLVRTSRPAPATAGAPAETPAPASIPAPASVPLAARRAAAKRATKRRRNVLGLILLATLAVIAVAAFGVISWAYTAIPATVLVAWLVTCRIMVKGERRALAPSSRILVDPVEEAVEAPEDRVLVDEVEHDADPMADTSAGLAAVVDPALWDPVPVTLPTYVDKPAATRRTVRTIDLEGTGVWTSGHTESDSQLAREAEQAEQAARQASAARKRATGS